MKRLLVITRAPWLNDNGIGSTLSDFFGDFSDFEIASLCLREATTVSALSRKNFSISESQLIRGLIKREPVGKITAEHSRSAAREKEEADMYRFSKKFHSSLLAFVREWLWSTNVWKNERLDRFLGEVQPDIVFFPDFPCVYAHKVLRYIRRKTNAKVAIFHADDCYTLKQFSLSPFFWAYRFYLRRWVRKTVKAADLHYVISDLQKQDYDRCFGVCHQVLTKFADFSQPPALKDSTALPLELVYTGNIGLNRWKSLAMIAGALKTINQDRVAAQLKIYTTNEISPKMRRALEAPGSVFLMGGLPPEEMDRVQTEADILVHAESLDLKNRLLVRLSFSTKIVDYLKRGRAILAVGPSEVASIRHLRDNDCAMIAGSQAEIVTQLGDVIAHPDKLKEYALRAYECGVKHHNRAEMLRMLHDDMTDIL